MRATRVLAVVAIGEKMGKEGRGMEDWTSGDKNGRINMLMMKAKRQTGAGSTQLALEDLHELLVNLGFEETSSTLRREAKKKGYQLKGRDMDDPSRIADENENIVHKKNHQHDKGGEASAKKSQRGMPTIGISEQNELVGRARELSLKARRVTENCSTTKKSSLMQLMRRQEEGNLSSRRTMLEAATSVGGGGLSLFNDCMQVKFDNCGVVACLRGHRSPLLHLDIIPKSPCFSSATCSEHIFTASIDNTIRLWSVGAGEGECVAIVKAGSMELADARMMELDHAMYRVVCGVEVLTWL